MDRNAKITQSLRDIAAQALSEGKVGVVIGYERPAGATSSVPVFIRKPEDAARLVFDDRCYGNLAIYISRPEIRSMGRTGLVVKGCDLRAVRVLLREHVVKREDLFLIGVRCEWVGEPRLSKCAVCSVHNPEDCDVVVGEPVEEAPSDAEKRYEDVAQMEGKSLEERWAFWQGQLSKCIRCYACRQVCPLCYCKRCVVEKSMPQWIETSPHLRGNLAWHAVRALHLTGRCVECGECERVCPVGIPLSIVNAKMAELVEEWFHFRSGLSSEEQAPFTVWSADDPETEIL